MTLVALMPLGCAKNDHPPGGVDAGAEVGPTCTPIAVRPVYAAPEVLFVIDASGSMVGNTVDHDSNAGTAEITRWALSRNALGEVLVRWGDTMLSGAQRFPSAAACPNATTAASNCYNSDACLTEAIPEVSVAPNNGTAILLALPGADADNVSIVGGTPTAAALDSAYGYLRGRGASADTQQLVVLITDGAANCSATDGFPDFIENYDSSAVSLASEALLQDGIHTFVVAVDALDAVTGAGADGVPEANAYAVLTDLARAGSGSASTTLVNVRTHADFVSGVEAMLNVPGACDVDLAATSAGIPPTAQVDSVSFSSGGVALDRVSDCAAGAGWTWISLGSDVRLCGGACEAFRRGATLDGVYGCPG